MLICQSLKKLFGDYCQIVLYRNHILAIIILPHHLLVTLTYNISSLLIAPQIARMAVLLKNDIIGQHKHSLFQI
jgi:hypothetical protein